MLDADALGGELGNVGDVLWPKINNVKLMGGPSDASGVIAQMQKSEEMIFMGDEQDGFVLVETSYGGGWVKSVLVTR